MTKREQAIETAAAQRRQSIPGSSSHCDLRPAGASAAMFHDHTSRFRFLHVQVPPAPAKNFINIIDDAHCEYDFATETAARSSVSAVIHGATSSESAAFSSGHSPSVCESTDSNCESHPTNDLPPLQLPRVADLNTKDIDATMPRPMFSTPSTSTPYSGSARTAIVDYPSCCNSPHRLAPSMPGPSPEPLHLNNRTPTREEQSQSQPVQLTVQLTRTAPCERQNSKHSMRTHNSQSAVSSHKKMRCAIL